MISSFLCVVFNGVAVRDFELRRYFVSKFFRENLLLQRVHLGQKRLILRVASSFRDDVAKSLILEVAHLHLSLHDLIVDVELEPVDLLVELFKARVGHSAQIHDLGCIERS